MAITTANSIIVLAGDGVTTQFTVNFTGGFLSESDVTCRVGEEVDGALDPVFRAITFINPGLISVAGPPAGVGIDVRFVRTTPIVTAVNDFAAGDNLDDVALDRGFDQLVKAVQEAKDSTAELDSSAASSAQAAASAAQTASDVILTNADVVATAADRVQTGLDVVSTNADVLLTAADRLVTNANVLLTNADVVLTAADAVQTAADRVQTGLDATATGNDATVTGNDKTATNADVVTTNADVVLTNADKAQTALDAIATAADRVQTGLDRVSTGNDVTATNADVILAEADKVQTGLDRIATGNDVTTTNANAVITIQDAIDTAANVVTTNADVVITTADKAATALDKLATNADVVLTNANVVLTAADVISSAANAAAAIVAKMDFQGNWATSTVYTISDVVFQLGSSYICVVGHTAGTFATDLAAVKWALVAEKGTDGIGAGDMLAVNNLTDLNNITTAVANLGLTIGTDVQAFTEVLQATTASYTTTLNAKMSGIEANAKDDQTAAQIKTLYQGEVKAFTDAQFDKLATIEASAKDDQTGAEIKTLYQAEANAFTDTKNTKLTGIEAYADVTDATNVNAAGAFMNSDFDAKGNLMSASANDTPVLLAVGANDFVLTAASGETTGLKWAAVPSPAGWGYTSADTTLSFASTTTFTHGLGAAPTKTVIDIVCVGAAHGYSIGDVVHGYEISHTNGEHATITVDNGNTTQLKVIVPAGGRMIHKSTHTVAILDATDMSTNFKFRIKASL